MPAGVIDDHHVGLVANPAPAHCLGEPVGRGQLRFDLVVRVDDVGRPVDEDRAWDVFPVVLVASADILRALPSLAQILGLDVAANVDDPESRIASTARQAIRD